MSRQPDDEPQPRPASRNAAFGDCGLSVLSGPEPPILGLWTANAPARSSRRAVSHCAAATSPRLLASKYWISSGPIRKPLLRLTCSLPQQLPQPLLPAPAHGDLTAVMEDGHALVLGEQLDAGDALDVCDVGAVHAHEP